MQSCTNQIEKLRLENQVKIYYPNFLNKRKKLYEENLKKTDIIQAQEEEKSEMLSKLKEFDMIHQNEQLKIKKLSQELNSYSSKEQEFNMIKNLYNIINV